MKARQYINMIGMAAAVLLSSCVKDTLYDTPHPDYGKIAVTADWSARGEGIDIPATWTVTMGDYTGTETSATHTPDHLFAPGSYTLAVWNPAEGITVNGTTATIAAATGTRAGTDAFVNNAPGWFFTYTKQMSIEKDKDYPLTAAMKQQVRELTLDFNLGLGYLNADFEKYEVIDGVRVRCGNETKNWWGPINAGVTLVWKLF